MKAQDHTAGMGLLTDPGAGRGKFTQLLVNYHGKLCIILYIFGIAWFLLLAYEPNNAGKICVGLASSQTD